MIIGYDFWCDGVFYDNTTSPIISVDNDGVAFDNCNIIEDVDKFTLKGGQFDEFNVTKDVAEIDNSTEKSDWTNSNVLLAKFKNDLVAGTIGIDGCEIKKLQVKKRRKNSNDLWQVYFTINYNENINIYEIKDKLIESEEDYEYCLCPIANDANGSEIHGNNTTPKECYISYDNTHIFDNTGSFDLIYNVKLSSMSNQIGANTIETLGSQYPFVVYGQSNYFKGSVECLLVTPESAVGEVNKKGEKVLRNQVLEFFQNKTCKILKGFDGLYMLVEIVGTPTITPTEIDGIYQIEFEYVQVGDINDVNSLGNLNIEFNYSTTQYIGDYAEQSNITKTVG